MENQKSSAEHSAPQSEGLGNAIGEHPMSQGGFAASSGPPAMPPPPLNLGASGGTLVIPGIKSPAMGAQTSVNINKAGNAGPNNTQLGKVLPQLAATPAEGMIQAFTGAKGKIQSAQTSDVTSAKAQFPVQPHPVGLTPETAPATAKSKTPVIKVPPGNKDTNVSEMKAYASNPPVKKAAPKNVSLKGDGGNVNLSAGDREVILLDGDLDPAQLDTQVSTSREEVLPDYRTAQTESAADFGESEVYPEASTEILEGTAPMPETLALDLPAMGVTPESITLAPFIGEELQNRLAPEVQAGLQAETAYSTEVETEKLAGEAEVETHTATLKAEQQKEKDNSIQSVGDHKQAWADENSLNLTDFNVSAAAEKAGVDKKVKAELDKGNSEINSEYTKAEKKVSDEHNHLNNKKPPKKKWWQKAWDMFTGFFKGLWNGFKKFIGDVWNALKSLVSGIINRVKKAIKGIMDGLKSLLNAVVQRIKEAFEAIAKKFAELIESVITALVDAFVKFVEVAKNAIKAVVDKVAKAIVDAVKKFVDAVVTVVKKIGEAIVDLLLMAGEAALRFILKALGVANADAVVDSLVSVVKAVLSDPIGFAKNLISTVTGTFTDYFKNIGANLSSVLTTWFFGDPTLQLPKDFSSESWIKFGMDASGINGDNIGQMVGAELALPGGISLDLASPIQSLVTGGPNAMWGDFREQLDAFPFVEVSGGGEKAEGESTEGTAGPVEEGPAGEGPENEQDAKLQLSSMTWETFMAEAGTFLPGGTVEQLNQAADIYQQLMAGEIGQLANDLMAQLGDQMSNVPAMMKEMALDWVKNDLLTQLPLLVASFTNPAGGVAKAFLAIYNGIMWCIENRAQIAELIGTVFSILPAIAAGDTAQAQELLTAGINQSIGMLLDLLTTTILNTSAAKHMGKMVDKLSEKVKNAFQGIMKSIQRAIQRFMEAIQKMMGKKKNNIKQAKAKKRAEEKAEAERLAKEKAEKEAAEKAEREAKEKEEREAKEKADAEKDKKQNGSNSNGKDKTEEEKKEESAPRERDYKGALIPNSENIGKAIRGLKRKVDKEEPIDSRFNEYGTSYEKQVKTYRVLQGLLDAHLTVNQYESANGLKKEDAEKVAGIIYAKHNEKKKLFKFFKVIDAENAVANNFDLPEGQKYWAFSFSASPTQESSIDDQLEDFLSDSDDEFKDINSVQIDGLKKDDKHKHVANEAPRYHAKLSATELNKHALELREAASSRAATTIVTAQFLTSKGNYLRFLFANDGNVPKKARDLGKSYGYISVHGTKTHGEANMLTYLKKHKKSLKYAGHGCDKAPCPQCRQLMEKQIEARYKIKVDFGGFTPAKKYSGTYYHEGMEKLESEDVQEMVGDIQENYREDGTSKLKPPKKDKKKTPPSDLEDQKPAAKKPKTQGEAGVKDKNTGKKKTPPTDAEDLKPAAKKQKTYDQEVGKEGEDPETKPAAVELDYQKKPIPDDAKIGSAINKLKATIHNLDPIDTKLPSYGPDYKGKVKTYKVLQGLKHAFQLAKGKKKDGEVSKENLQTIAQTIDKNHKVFTAFRIVGADQAKNKSFDTSKATSHWAFEWSASPWYAAVVAKKKQESNSEAPQSLFMKQPSSGELAAFCGYYALCHHQNRRLSLDAFRDQVYGQYREMGLPDSEIAGLISDMGTGMEGLATQQFGYSETGDQNTAISKGRFMAATQRYGGHWLAYIKAQDGTWWEYDSWQKSAPTMVGDETQLKATLNKANTGSMYYGGGSIPQVSDSADQSNSNSENQKKESTEKSGASGETQEAQIEDKAGKDYQGNSIPGRFKIKAAIGKLKRSIHALDPINSNLPSYGSDYKGQVKTYKVLQGVLHAYQLASGSIVNGEASKEDLKSVVGRIKAKHAVFTSFGVVEAGQARNKSFDTSKAQDHWAFEWSASPWYAAIIGKKPTGLFNNVPNSNLAPTTPGLSSAAALLPGQSHHKQNIMQVHDNLGKENNNLQNGKWENREHNLNEAMKNGAPGDGIIDTKVRNDVYVAGIIKDEKMLREAAQFSLDMCLKYKPGGERASFIQGSQGPHMVSHAYPDQDTSGTKNTDYRGWTSLMGSTSAHMLPQSVSGIDKDFLSKSLAKNEPKLRLLVAKKGPYTLDERMYILRTMGQCRDIMKPEKKPGGVIKEFLKTDNPDQPNFDRIRDYGKGTGVNRDVPKEHKASRHPLPRYVHPYGTYAHKDDEIYNVQGRDDERDPERFDYLMGTSGTTLDMVNFFLAQGKDKEEATRLTQVFYANWHAIAPDGNAHSQSESIGTMLQYLHRTNLKKPITAPIKGSEDVEGMIGAGYANELTAEHPGYMHKQTEEEKRENARRKAEKKNKKKKK